MTILRNPYVAGNPVGNSPAFIGREGVLREVLRVLRRPQDNAIVLYGQRRIGKTSILQHLASRLPEVGPYRPVYFDLQDKAAWPLGRLLQDMARVIAHALGQPEPDLGPDPEAAFRGEWLSATLDSLPEDTAVVLLLDEFDVLSDPRAEQAAAAFFPYLRGLLARDPDRLQFEFVIGRNVDDLSSIALSVFKGTPARHISLLSQEDSAQLVRLSETNDTLRWPDEAVERVWEWAHGHPFLTQQLCSHVWERAYDDVSLHEDLGEPPAVTPAEVDAAVPEALDASKNTMEWLWDGLPPAARVVASALAEAGAEAISPEALERLLYDSGVRVVIRELQSAPRLLQDWDLIEPTDGGYCFRVELLRRWIAESKPLRRVQEELDHIEPVAENLYQAAQGLYQNGQLEQAVGLLRQAIGLNPNHVRANQLLADMLLAQGDASEAAQLLGQLYEYQPAAARPRLIQALLTQAKGAANDDESLDLYARVLAFDPVQPEAAAEKRRIWEQRGDAALERGALETALQAYEAGDITGKTARVTEEMNRRALAVAMQALEDAEREGAYDQALELAHTLADRYPEYRDWTPELERLERKTKLKELYQRALGALQSGDRQTARSLLGQVVAVEPSYEEATRYLHLAVSGVDPAKARGCAASAGYTIGRPFGWVRRVLRNPVAQRRLGIGILVVVILAIVAGALFSLYQHSTGSLRPAAFSPDGRVLASAFIPSAGNDKVILWDLETGEKLHTLRHSQGYTVNAALFSPDGSTVAVDFSNTWILWDSLTGAQLHTFSGYYGALSPDWTRFAEAGYQTVWLWDVETGDLLHTLEGHTDYVYSVAFSPDGTALASGSDDDTVIVWDVATGEQLHTLAGHTDDVTLVAFSPAGTTLASGSDDKTVVLWDAITGKPLRMLRLSEDYSVTTLVFSPDGTTLATQEVNYNNYSYQTILWDVETGAELHRLEGYDPAFTPDGSALVTVLSGSTTLWDVETGAELFSLAGTSPVFRPDGAALATYRYDTIRLWDVATGVELHEFVGSSPTFSSDGTMLATSSDGDVLLWDVETGNRLRAISSPWVSP